MIVHYNLFGRSRCGSKRGTITDVVRKVTCAFCRMNGLH